MPPPQHPRDLATGRVAEVNDAGAHGLHAQPLTLTEVDKRLELSGRPVQPVGVPGDDRVGVPLFETLHHRRVAGPQLAAVSGDIVVRVGPDHEPAHALSQRHAVFTLPVDPEPSTLAVLADADVDYCSGHVHKCLSRQPAR